MIYVARPEIERVMGNAYINLMILGGSTYVSFNSSKSGQSG